MSPPQLLFVLRLAGAFLLLAFLGVIVYSLYRDALSVRFAGAADRGQTGVLRVVASRDNKPPLDTRYDLGSSCTIGRNKRNAIVLDDSFVSQEHARILRREGHWWLEDLGSRNGTLLNDVPVISETVVTAGDTITVGRVAFRLEAAANIAANGVGESGIRDSNP